MHAHAQQSQLIFRISHNTNLVICQRPRTFTNLFKSNALHWKKKDWSKSTLSVSTPAFVCLPPEWWHLYMQENKGRNYSFHLNLFLTLTPFHSMMDSKEKVPASNKMSSCATKYNYNLTCVISGSNLPLHTQSITFQMIVCLQPPWFYTIRRNNMHCTPRSWSFSPCNKLYNCFPVENDFSSPSLKECTSLFVL